MGKASNTLSYKIEPSDYKKVAEASYYGKPKKMKKGKKSC